VYVEEDRYPISLEGESREDDEVRHGVSLNEIERTPAVVMTESPPGGQHKPAIVEDISHRVTAPVAGAKDPKYLDSIDYRFVLAALLEAENGHRMTGLGQRLGLAPNPWIGSVMCIGHHGHTAHGGNTTSKVS
jgi:hypothetical protein